MLADKGKKKKKNGMSKVKVFNDVRKKKKKKKKKKERVVLYSERTRGKSEIKQL